MRINRYYGTELIPPRAPTNRASHRVGSERPASRKRFIPGIIPVQQLSRNDYIGTADIDEEVILYKENPPDQFPNPEDSPCGGGDGGEWNSA